MNSLNIYKYNFRRLNQGPQVQIYKFWGLIRPNKWDLGVFTVIPMWGSIHPGRSAQCPINHALPATWALAERFNNGLGQISQQQETCGWIILWVGFEIYPKWLSSVGRLVRLSYELNMALENFTRISLIFGYLLENHVRKSDDFSLNFGYWESPKSVWF